MQVTVGKKLKTSTKKKSSAPDIGSKEQTPEPDDKSDVQTTVQKGSMVALCLQKYADDLSQIGKVVNLTDMDVIVEWWIGSYSSTWEQWKERGVVITETFTRNAIIHSRITFTKALRLPKDTVQKLKLAYDAKELI